MAPFADATAVCRTAPGFFEAEIKPGWDILGNANGGYLIATAGRAMAATAQRPDPVSMTAHYLSPGRAGPVGLETTLVKAGSRFSSVSATMSSTKPVVAALGTFGELGRSGSGDDEARLVDGRPPELPEPEACLPLDRGDEQPSFMKQVEMRLHPDDAGFAFGKPSGSARMRGWFRLRDAEPIDTIALLCAVDAFPPTIFNANLPVGWAPTVELTAHIRARPEPGWLACAFTSRFVTGGFLEADGELWDSTGELVAQSRQLALVPREAPTDG
ncbi:MAG: thioesterase family protein [Microthrixaceae bacterium]